MLKIEKMPLSIDIGYVGETAFRAVQVDMTSWMKETPEGVPSIVHIRPGETKADAYVAVTTFDSETNVLTWVITAADIGTAEGEGELQIWLEKEENESIVKRGKSVKVVTKVTDAVNDPSETVPTGQEAFLEQITGLKTMAVSAAENAVAAARHYPYVNTTNNHWMLWDITENNYVDTGVDARGIQGERGPQGERGYKGDTGNTGPQGIEGPQGTAGADGGVGVVLDISADAYAFRVGEDGHLYIDYASEDEPGYSIDDRGHLIRTIGDDSELDLGMVKGAKGDKGDKGDRGTDGQTPDVSGKADKVTNATNGNLAMLDSNGNLMDSGKKAGDFYVWPSGGIPANDLAQGVLTSMIDDTAGEGDDNKTWSADKLDEEFGSVLNAIQGKMDEPETAGTAGQIMSLDSNLDPVWVDKNLVDNISGSTPSITGVADTRYICGEVSTLSIIAPASGCIDVIFISGSTPTVLTVTSAKANTTIKWANGFDPTSLDANTAYELNIMDGEYGVVASWT